VTRPIPQWSGLSDILHPDRWTDVEQSFAQDFIIRSNCRMVEEGVLELLEHVYRPLQALKQQLARMRLRYCERGVEGQWQLQPLEHADVPYTPAEEGMLSAHIYGNRCVIPDGIISAISVHLRNTRSAASIVRKMCDMRMTLCVRERGRWRVVPPPATRGLRYP
jgi:hypothetical protein